MNGGVQRCNIKSFAQSLRAVWIFLDPVLGRLEMYINFVAHLKYSYLLCMLPTAM
jgi:hypothetical protein